MQQILKTRAVAMARSCVMGLLLVVSAVSWSTAHAQLPTPLPTPNVNLLTSGDVYAIARLADGSVVMGGRFVSVNGSLRSNIAKRSPDGTLDPNWHPVIDGDVRALAVDAAGNVYVGGQFSHADGYERRNLVKLSPAGAVVAGWDPSPDGLVQAILLNAVGEAFVGGWFENIGGQARSRLAKVSSSTGAVDSQWNPAPAAATAILVLRLSHDGRLYVGGQFEGIGDFPQRRNIAKVSMTGTGAVDPDWDPSPNSTVTDITVGSDGSVFITGEFFEFRTSTSKLWFQRNLAKLSGTGSGLIVEGWDPLNFEQVSAARRVAVDGSGWVYVSGGQFPYFPDDTFSEVIRVSAGETGQIDVTWNPQVSGPVYVLLADDSTVLVGGSFWYVAGQTRLGFVALDGNANAGPAFDVEGPGFANYAIATQADGRVIVSGTFSKANGQLRGGLLRLNADGSLDMGWDPSPDGTVNAIAFATDGSIIVGGFFSQIGGQSVHSIAKLSSVDGTADPVWKPYLIGQVRSLASDNAGLVYVGGGFLFNTTGTFHPNLVRLQETGVGEADGGWAVQPDAGVDELSLDGQGALFIRGSFLNINGQPRKRIAKLLTTGPTWLDPHWNPQPAGQIHQIVADGLGSVFVAGGFFPIAGGGSTAAIAKLSASGVGQADPLWRPFTDRLARRITLDVTTSSLYAVSNIYDPSTGVDSYFLTKHSTNGTGEVDPSWNPTVNDFVSFIEVSSSRLLLGGYFTQVSGEQRYGLAALPLSVPDVILADGFDIAP